MVTRGHKEVVRIKEIEVKLSLPRWETNGYSTMTLFNKGRMDD